MAARSGSADLHRAAARAVLDLTPRHPTHRRASAGHQYQSVVMVAHFLHRRRDDGVGFDVGATRTGTGLQGLGDRLEAIVESLQVRSASARAPRSPVPCPLPPELCSVIRGARRARYRGLLNRGAARLRRPARRDRPSRDAPRGRPPRWRHRRLADRPGAGHDPVDQDHPYRLAVACCREARPQLVTDHAGRHGRAVRCRTRAGSVAAPACRGPVAERRAGRNKLRPASLRKVRRRRPRRSTTSRSRVNPDHDWTSMTSCAPVGGDVAHHDAVG